MRKGEQTKEMILRRAAPIFNRRGYYGASLSDIMKATGLEKGGIYNHFGSKEELALQSFNYSVELVAERFREALHDKRDACDRLLAIISVFEGIARGEPVPGGCPVFNTAIETDDTNQKLCARAREVMDDWYRLIDVTVQKGVKRQEIREGTDPEGVATILIATLEGAVMLTRLYDDPVHILRAIDHLTGYIEALRP